jgi:hypothetical protein
LYRKVDQPTNLWKHRSDSVVFFCELHLGSPNFKLDWSRSSG